MPAKLERCVRKVRRRKGVRNAYAICNASLRRRKYRRARENPLSTEMKVGIAVVAAGAIAAAAYFALRPKVTTPPPSSQGGGGGGGGSGIVPVNGGGGTPQAPLTFVGPADNGTTVQLNIGDMLVVSLPEDPSTGATWSSDESGAPLRFLVDGIVPAVPPQVPAHTFTYQAAQSGSATVTAKLTAPSGTVTQTWSVNAQVAGQVATGGSAGNPAGITTVLQNFTVKSSTGGSSKVVAVRGK